jgi:hypothetical protein
MSAVPLWGGDKVKTKVKTRVAQTQVLFNWGLVLEFAAKEKNNPRGGLWEDFSAVIMGIQTSKKQFLFLFSKPRAAAGCNKIRWRLWVVFKENALGSIP